MRSLEKAIHTYRDMSLREDPGSRSGDPRCALLVCLLFLVTMLSVPVRSLQTLIFFAIYPAVGCTLAGVGLWKVVKKSLYVLPFIVMIGVFNPVYHRAVAFTVGGIAVSEGWLEFISILLRGLLSVQALLMLIERFGFAEICRSMRRLGVPGFLCTQLLLVYRYIGVLMEEALDMKRAREARGYVRRGLGLKMWAALIGQLFIRSVERSQRIYRSMLSRGFTGDMPSLSLMRTRWGAADTLTLTAWASVFAALRFINIPQLFHFA